MKPSPDLAPAFKIIGTYDPALRDAMDASPAIASTDSSVLPSELSLIVLLSALGATQTEDDNGQSFAQPRIWINTNIVLDFADRTHVPQPYVQAAVLAHEFRHTCQHGRDNVGAEREAFAAGRAFTRKLPEPYRTKILAEFAADEPAELAYMDEV